MVFIIHACLHLCHISKKNLTILLKHQTEKYLVQARCTAAIPTEKKTDFEAFEDTCVTLILLGIRHIFSDQIKKWSAKTRCCLH